MANIDTKKDAAAPAPDAAAPAAASGPCFASPIQGKCLLIGTAATLVGAATFTLIVGSSLSVGGALTAMSAAQMGANVVAGVLEYVGREQKDD